MARQKTTEDALRAYVRSEEKFEAQHQLRGVLDRIAERSDLTDEQAMQLANEELHAMRRGE